LGGLTRTLLIGRNPGRYDLESRGIYTQGDKMKDKLISFAKNFGIIVACLLAVAVAVAVYQWQMEPYQNAVEQSGRLNQQINSR